jgi:peptide deformylase
MAILKIARMGHPVLRGRAQPVEDPTAPEIRRLIEDMLETMDDADGVGLAAPQVHVPLRLVVFRLPPERLTAGESGDERIADAAEARSAEDIPMALINPVLEPLGPEQELGWEGCLSVPGLRGVVPRLRRIRYSGFDERGRPIDREAEGFHARVVQHECDHLDGILYPMRIRDLSKFGFNEALFPGQDLPAED